MLHYDEFVERRDDELMDKYKHTNIRDYLTYEDFCVQEYEAYVLACVKVYHKVEHQPLPQYFGIGALVSEPPISISECDIPF